MLPFNAFAQMPLVLPLPFLVKHVLNWKKYIIKCILFLCGNDLISFFFKFNLLFFFLRKCFVQNIFILFLKNATVSSYKFDSLDMWTFGEYVRFFGYVKFNEELTMIISTKYPF